MLKPEQVPKECLVAYQRAFKAGGGPADGIAAAINAWPGMTTRTGLYTDLILPLTETSTKENDNG